MGSISPTPPTKSSAVPTHRERATSEKGRRAGAARERCAAGRSERWSCHRGVGTFGGTELASPLAPRAQRHTPPACKSPGGTRRTLAAPLTGSQAPRGSSAVGFELQCLHQKHSTLRPAGLVFLCDQPGQSHDSCDRVVRSRSSAELRPRISHAIGPLARVFARRHGRSRGQARAPAHPETAPMHF